MSAIKTAHWKVSFLLGPGSGPVSFYTVSFHVWNQNVHPSLPNWSSRILTVSHMWQIGQGQDNKIYVQIEYPNKMPTLQWQGTITILYPQFQVYLLYRCFGDYRTVVIASDFYWPKTMPASFGIAVTTRHQELSLVESFGKYDCRTRSTSTLAISSLILFTPSLKRQPQSLKTSELL